MNFSNCLSVIWNSVVVIALTQTCNSTGDDGKAFYCLSTLLGSWFYDRTRFTLKSNSMFMNGDSHIQYLLMVLN